MTGMTDTTIDWRASGDYTDIVYETTSDGIAKITINRPEVHNAFRPQTLIEVSDALMVAREDESVGVIILTGAGDKAFCSGGDQRVRGDSGYKTDEAATGRFHVTDLHVAMRRCPKPIIAMVAGYAVGGGHILHMIADLTIAADNAIFGQTGPKVGSFDGGFGSATLARMVGQKKAKEISVKLTGRLRKHAGNPKYKALAERLEDLKNRHQQGLLLSIDFLKELLALAKDVVKMERETPVEEDIDRGKGE